MTTKSDRDVPVAIVGGGASGTMLALQLARRGIRSALIDGSGRAGLGIAYSTVEPAHLLNVRADRMSAMAGDSDHFARRFEAEGGQPAGFAPRRLFGRYLRDMLEQSTASGQILVDHATAMSATRNAGGWSIELDRSKALNARALVLATGNQEPEPIPAFAAVGDRYVNNPWTEDARAAVTALVGTGGSALLIGTGLTMVDLAQSLDAAGHHGRIVALSRRGQVPRAHADIEASPIDRDDIPHGNLRALWRWLRRRSAEVGWRAAIDGLRPHSHALWQAFDLDQQQRFMRHARPWWDVHRHRIAPEVAATIHRMVATGRLEILAGRVIAARLGEDRVNVEIRRRGADQGSIERFEYVINCTGPLHAMARTRNPLLRHMLDSGAVRIDRLDIGLEVDDRSRAGNGIWALGPLTKARYWEIIAVPDIREQAAAVADDIARELEE
ncbi:MAG: FAD/NAD(P)-binding protein [Sphingomicrobium sp.]